MQIWSKVRRCSWGLRDFFDDMGRKNYGVIRDWEWSLLGDFFGGIGEGWGRRGDWDLGGMWK